MLQHSGQGRYRRSGHAGGYHRFDPMEEGTRDGFADTAIRLAEGQKCQDESRAIAGEPSEMALHSARLTR